MTLLAALNWIQEHPRTDFTIEFRKADGTVREMKCQTGVDDGTLVKNPMKEGAKSSPDAVKVYDMDAKAYRSFRKDSLLTITIGGVKHTID